MRIITRTIETEATPIQIWKVWEDVENWKTWDQEVEFSYIDGPFQAGTTGRTKFIKTPSFKTLLTKVEPLKSVVQEAYINSFAKVISHQLMERVGNKTQVTFRIEIRGPLAFLFACFCRRFIQKKLPSEMEEMVRRAKIIQKLDEKFN